MKQKWPLLIAVVVGVVAFWLTHRYLKEIRDELYKAAETIEVLAAAKDLPEGTILEFEDLGIKTVFKSAVGDNIFRRKDLNLVLNKKLKFSLGKKEPLWWTHVDLPSRMQGGLAPMIKSGMRAISISVGGDASVSGLVEPNDRVDILGTYTFPSKDDPVMVENVTLTLLQDVTVLATGTRLARQEGIQRDSRRGRTGSYSLVTLEVTPREAELLVFAQSVKGKLTLSLRNPDDVSFEKDLPSVNFQHLQNNLLELNNFRQKNIRHKKQL